MNALYQQAIILRLIGLSVFMITLFYAAFKAFSALNVIEGERSAEGRARAVGFVIGILLTVLFIIADVSPGPFSLSSFLTVFPWYVFSCLGIIFGLGVAIMSKLLNDFRATSGTGLILLVLSLVSSTGLYLTLFSPELQSSALATLISILIGLLSFRLLFPGTADTGSMATR